MFMSAISLFSGAGGMDVGFKKAGFQTIWANDINSDACLTFAANHSDVIRCGALEQFMYELASQPSPDVLIGGPPCQGFSVAGRMDLSDPRSQLVYKFMDAVEQINPRAFVLENVKALACLEKFRTVRERLFSQAEKLGYNCSLTVLKASEYGVPQNRERMFLVGFNNGLKADDFISKIKLSKHAAPRLKDVIKPLGRAGTINNSKICRAKITMAANPVLRQSPYAGMLFNGQGRPLNPDGFASTLPASMGGNRTPIIDEAHLFDNKPSWIEEYHLRLLNGGTPLNFEAAPQRLRRLTIDEAILIQTFPEKYNFKGSNSSIFQQIGNAVPCELAFHVAKSVKAVLNGYISSCPSIKQLKLELLTPHCDAVAA